MKSIPRWLSFAASCACILMLGNGRMFDAHATAAAPLQQTATHKLVVQSSEPTIDASIVLSPADTMKSASGTAPATFQFLHGVKVTVTAPVTIGSYSLKNWTGCDAQVAHRCLVTLNDNRTVTANYVPSTTMDFQLVIASLSPLDGVNVAVAPGDKNGKTSGSTPLVLTYKNGTKVEITAPTTMGGNNFNNWSGCDSVANRTCTVTVTANRTVTADYSSPTGPESITPRVPPGKTAGKPSP